MLRTGTDMGAGRDLRGRRQPEIHTTTPRLERALGDLSRILDAPVDPAEPTWALTATETGVEAPVDHDGEHLNVFALHPQRATRPGRLG